MKRILLRSLLIIVALYLVLSVALYASMLQSPSRLGRIMAHVPIPLFMILPFEPLWTHARAGHIGAGDAAPDFRLPMLDHSSQVQLSAFRGSRPVVLVFGSYT